MGDWTNYALVALGLVLGLPIGAMIEARRWRLNADEIQRIESRGKLYKVRRDF